MPKKISNTYPIPENKVGIGLRAPHIDHVISQPQDVKKDIGWLEVHSENYYSKSNPSINSLIEIRKDFPISLHCVGNSLGSASGLDLKHLKDLKRLIKIIDPFLISDHISWGKVGNMHLNDLLPLPYTKESLQIITDNINQMQDFLGRQILIENPSTYLAFSNNEVDEAEFINKTCSKTGCKLLLDVNNIYVSSTNNKEFDPTEYLEALDKNIVGEIHLAGHSKKQISDGKSDKEILIDTHNDVVCKEVWQLFDLAIKSFGQIPSLVEWDQDIPDLKILTNEAKKAQNILKINK